MAVTGVPTITAPGIPEDVSRPLPSRDPVLAGVSNAGIRFMYDMAFPWCYPGGSPVGRPAAGNPAAGAIVQDMAERANGSIQNPGAGSVLAYAGGGIDFTSSIVGANPAKTGIVAPASVLADIFAAYNGKSQRFLVVDYMKLPAKAAWVNVGTIATFVCDEPFNLSPSLINLAMGSGPNIQARRQTAAATATQINVTPNDADFGTVCQIATWRTDTEFGLRVRSLTSGASALLATAAMGADNTQDFSANTLGFGRHPGFSGGGSAAMAGLRHHRGWIENLARSGRDPIAVLDADFARQQARGLYS